MPYIVVMTDVLIVLGFALTYFVLLGVVNFCHLLMGDKSQADIRSNKNSKSDKK